ncbi:VOC family protein [Streptomyces sp. NPDC012751]|uniref:VOC family protein n=1 Tax=Streptomyces sp. NPDC012751 TaxID=3364846 RepID=UPI0036AE9629
MAAQTAFYRAALGLDVEGRDDAPDRPVRTVLLGRADGPRLKLVARAGSRSAGTTPSGGGTGAGVLANGVPGRAVHRAAAVQGFFQLAFAVRDLDAAHARFLRAGAVGVSPRGQRGGRVSASPTWRTPRVTSWS